LNKRKRKRRKKGGKGCSERSQLLPWYYTDLGRVTLLVSIGGLNIEKAMLDMGN